MTGEMDAGDLMTLDARRTALFIGFLFESPHMRIVGIDRFALHSITRVALGKSNPMHVAA